MTGARLDIDGTTSLDDVLQAVAMWVESAVPEAWRIAATDGEDALRAVRPRADYEAWYPTMAAAGLVVPTWLPEHGGLDVSRTTAAAIDRALKPYRLHRLNPLGLHNAAAALFAHGTDEQRQRFLPPMVRNEERWCQLFSEPGAGSDLASLACRATRDGDRWVIHGQKVWTTWADKSELAILLARTDPDAPKHRGMSYFVLDLRQPGVQIRPLRQLTGEAEFNEVFLDGATIPDTHRIGAIGDGWRVSASTLSSERAMVSGSGTGPGVGRLGGVSATAAIELARSLGRNHDDTIRQRLAGLWSEEQIRSWTDQRVGAARRAGQETGATSSIGKIHQADLNQRLQLLVVDVVGNVALAWDTPTDESGPSGYGASLPSTVRGMLRSRANSIEGGTTEVNKNIVAERVLGLPREPDPWHGRPWREVPRS